MRLKIFILLLFFNINIFANETKVNIGVLYEKIFTTKREAQIGAKIWLKYMKDKEYFEGINVVFYEDEKLILKDYVNNKISGMISNLTLYYKNKKILDKVTGQVWIPSTTKEIYEQYYLIKNKGSSINLDNLYGKNLYYKNDIGKVWVESFILKKYKKPINKVFKKVLEIEKPQKLIFNTFFNENELSVVTKKLYDSMRELNPQIEQKVTIIKKSKAMFFSGIGFTHKKMEEKHSRMLEKMTKDINSSENGVELVSLIDLVRILVVREDDLKELSHFYNEYFKYQRLYK